MSHGLTQLVERDADKHNASEHNSRSGQFFACFAALSLKQLEHYPEHYGEETNAPPQNESIPPLITKQYRTRFFCKAIVSYLGIKTKEQPTCYQQNETQQT
jgi:hypothetical protein